MKPLHVATGILGLALAACGYDNSNYNNETAYNEEGAAYNDTGANYSADANYTADESNYTATNATGNETVDMNAVANNTTDTTTTNY